MEAAAAQIVQLIRAIPDTNLRAHGLDWTVGETATHLVWVTRGYTLWASGRGAPEWGLDRLAETNARLINELPGRRPAALADLFAEGARGFLETTANVPGDRPVPWFGGHTLSLASATTVADRRAARTPRHRRDHLGAAPDGQPADRRDGHGDLRDSCARGLSVEPLSASPVDCHISADPVALLLVSIGRVSPWRAVARGKLVAWGRKPWLGWKYRSLLTNL